MSPPLTYGPAYLGLYAALVLGIVCNAFLDIGHGTFGVEVLLWAAIFAYTLYVGWRQKGVEDEDGRHHQKIVLTVGAVATILFFLPIWGLPRGGLYVLAALQAGMNCVTTTRRNLHFGLLVSLIMVMFAATHWRADWLMLFYLLPYIVAAVFTLVSEQINRRAEEVRHEGLGLPFAGGQGAAIGTATGAILAIAALLYVATPKISMMNLHWKYGQPAAAGIVGGASVPPGGNAAGTARLPANEASQPEGQVASGGLPTIAQMRAAAGRPGLPGWQSWAIEVMADLAEGTLYVLQPLDLGIQRLIDAIKCTLREHLPAILTGAWLLAIVALLVAAWLLMREARPILWLLARFDYLRLALLGRHAGGARGARQYYSAMERLFDVNGLDRPPTANTREYLYRIGRRFDHLRRDATELTLIFERARYGNREPSPAELENMRRLYRRLFHGIGRLTSE